MEPPKTIDEALSEFKDKLKELNHEYSDLCGIKYNTEEKIKSINGDILNMKALVEKYEKMKASEILKNAIGSYFISVSYREDSKMGRVKIGKILGLRNACCLNYTGIEFYYTSTVKYSLNMSVDDAHKILISNIKYTNQDQPYPEWLSTSNLSEHIDGELITHEEYQKHLSKLTMIREYTDEKYLTSL